jgi:hypothetical protein
MIRLLERAARAAVYKTPYGRLIVIDDCVTGQFYDGALQAYTEFVTAWGRPVEVVHGKLGIFEIG